uniref:Uncharacterized protein n=1 Tax=Caldiarchaeum subterraneum TaxID=311458 RepID=A0A7C5U6R9_CALS0
MDNPETQVYAIAIVHESQGRFDSTTNPSTKHPSATWHNTPHAYVELLGKPYPVELMKPKTETAVKLTGRAAFTAID